MRRGVPYAFGAAAVVVIALVTVLARRAPATSSVTAAPATSSVTAAPATSSVTAAPATDPIAHLRAFEQARRAEARFLETTTQDRAFGADPYDVAATRDGRVVGILRGRDAIVLLDADLHELTRAPTVRSPSAVAVYTGRSAGDLNDGDVLVASELEPVLARYRVNGATLERRADVKLGDVLAVRGIATGPEGIVYVIEEHDHRLLTLRFSASGVERSERIASRGPLRITRTRDALIVASLLDHALEVLPVDPRGAPQSVAATARIDGPFWGLAARDVPGTSDVLIVATGPEDHPLDRREGFFGYVDSFVYVYRWSPARSELRRVAAINAGEHGLIVPKAIAFGADGAAIVTSYGAAKGLRLAWPSGVEEAPTVTPIDLVPGVSAIVRTPAGFVAADPLLDAWIRIGAGEAAPPWSVAKVDAEGDTRTDRERLGEALFFTGLMAPAGSSEGAKSRFSCETCHFEGYVDGRIHHTGRGEVHATTKPLVGLFNNRPHFSRALDPDLSAVAENEFRVAGAPSRTDPHFTLEPSDAPWLVDLGVATRRYDAAELRLSLMAFLISFRHRTNPRAAVVRPFTDEERAGAVAFRDRCERCHEARAAADVPASRVAFDRWEELLLRGGGPLVWASDAYEKTGVEPYVHERGARVPSLRRIYKKRPLFTNGSAADVANVLERARFGAAFSHDGTTSGASLDAPTARALGAFVDLL